MSYDDDDEWMESPHCNAATGYPVWCLFYRYTPKAVKP